MKKTITLEEAYKMAVSAIPGHAINVHFNLCRIEMRSNLARIFEHGEKPVENMRYVPVEKPVETAGKSSE